MNNEVWTVEGWLEQIQSFLSKLYGLPGGVLVLVSCIAVGYILRVWRIFPNKAIPVVAISWGPIFNILVADPCADSLPLRIWLVKNFLVGLIIGVVAWAIHNKLLAKIESKIPWLGGKLNETEQTKPQDNQ